MSTADPILIHAPELGYNRFKIARDIQNACNTSGVAGELIRVIEDAARDPKCGRASLAHDPAVVAVIDKLSSLMPLRGPRPVRQTRRRPVRARVPRERDEACGVKSEGGSGRPSSRRPYTPSQEHP